MLSDWEFRELAYYAFYLKHACELHSIDWKPFIEYLKSDMDIDHTMVTLCGDWIEPVLRLFCSGEDYEPNFLKSSFKYI